MALQAQRLLQTHCALGEGAIWDHDAQKLYWIDIDGKTVFIYDPATGTNTPYPLPDRPGTVVKRSKGGLALAMGNGFVAFDPASGRLETLAEPEKGRAGHRFNDGKCDPAGRFWAGSMPYSGPKGSAYLWRLDADRSTHMMLDGISCSNGIVWTADRSTMLYIDTPTSHVDAFDYDDATGIISNRRTVIDVPKDIGHPDGSTLDADGMLWVAMWGGGTVVRWNPKTGKALETIEVPGAKNVTSAAFGDQDLQTLYITCAGGDNEKHRADYPNAGDLFSVRVANTRGVPAVAYAG